jgi:hypothetical protein
MWKREKYKNCHWSKDQEAPIHASIPKPVLQERPTFKHLIENFNTDPIIKMIGILQLLPINHGR